MMRLVTWNINSVRMREDMVIRLIEEQSPDVICLQETKVEDDKFPAQVYEDLGYMHVEKSGMKAYHGVATLSRLPVVESERIDFCDKGDARHRRIKLDNKVEVHNFYVPAGGDEPDVTINEKFDHKMNFLQEMIDLFEAQKKQNKPMILVGDINIAPHENDVWDTKKLKNVVSHTQIEKDILERVMASHDWIDAVREHIPLTEKAASWWSYRAKDWLAANKGRRLDHIWMTPALSGKCKSVEILSEVRGWQPKPSDHCPIIADFDV
jgi:exodeoxyribonuclease-3